MEITMHYKTIIFELLQQRTELYERLRKERKLLPTLELYAKELKTSHEVWKARLLAMMPGSDQSQIATEAMEMALLELENHLPPESPQSDALSLDAAMAFVLGHTPRA
jgi:hypothetical protein